MISFFVPGIPAPQGSKRYLGPGRVVESSKRAAPWRADVRGSAEAALRDKQFSQGLEKLWDVPVEIELVFSLPRPKGHYGTGRNAGTLKDSAPLYPAVTPDLDKLARAVLDGLTGVVFADDKTVVTLTVFKVYADNGRPGVDVTVDMAP